MKIGIIARTKDDILQIPFTYLNILKENSYPIIIDSSLDLDKNKDYLLNQLKELNGFILTGGTKIEKVDLFIIDYCYNNNIPLLGICLGMQEIAYYFSNKQPLLIKNDDHFDLEKKYLHKIKLTKKGYLINLLNKDTLLVNSRHHYQIEKDKHYHIEATCNNVIEAIKVKNTKYMLGLQFHPEIMYEYDDLTKEIFKDFFNNCI